MLVIKVPKHTNIQYLDFQVTLSSSHIPILGYLHPRSLNSSSWTQWPTDTCWPMLGVHTCAERLAPQLCTNSHLALTRCLQINWPYIGHYTNSMYINMYTYSHATQACSCKYIHIYSHHTYLHHTLIILAYSRKPIGAGVHEVPMFC